MAKVTSKKALVVGAAALATGAAIVATRRRSHHEAPEPKLDAPSVPADLERRMTTDEPEISLPDTTT